MCHKKGGQVHYQCCKSVFLMPWQNICIFLLDNRKKTIHFTLISPVLRFSSTVECRINFKSYNTAYTYFYKLTLKLI